MVCCDHSSENNSEEAVYNEKNAKLSKRHGSGSSGSHGGHGSSSRKNKHHRHSHKHRTSTDNSHDNHAGVDHELGGAANDHVADADDMSNIYDSPKVPPIPVVMNSAASLSFDGKKSAADAAISSDHYDHMHHTTTDNNCNLNQVANNNGEALQKEEVVYDVPRSNPRKVHVDNQKLQPKEAIYVNNIIQQETNLSQSEHNHHIDNTYDVPRTNATTNPPLNVSNIHMSTYFFL